MKKILFFTLVGLLAVHTAGADGFTLSSPHIKNKEQVTAEQVLNGFGCQGGNVSPALQWQDAPRDAKSFAVTVYDPDAPTGSGWWHWVVFNIPAHVSGLQKNAGSLEAGLAPAGSIQGRTDFGKPGYGGPCPPTGGKRHRYQFTVYALKTDKLPLDENAPAAMVGYYLYQNLIQKTVLTGYYSR